MNTKKRRRTAQDDRRSKPQAASSSKHGEKMSTDPIYVLETIGVEGEPKLEEWNYLRNAGYDELEKYNIPPNLVEAVRGFRPHASVRWLNEKGEPASPNDRMVEAVVASPKEEGLEKFAESSESTLPETAGGALAECLRFQLSQVRQSTALPVGSGGLLAPSSISRIAIDMLETFALFGQAPAPELVDLIRLLLNVDKRKLKSDREFASRDAASWMIAQQPTLPIRQIARHVGVEPTSVMRWKSDPVFNELVQDKKDTIKDFEKRGLWPPKSKGLDGQDWTASDWLAQLSRLIKSLGRLKFRSEEAKAKQQELIEVFDRIPERLSRFEEERQASDLDADDQ